MMKKTQFDVKPEDDKVEDEDSCCDNSSDLTFEIDKFDFDLTSIFMNKFK